MAKENSEGCWISVILRIAVSALFVAAAVPKWMAGPESLVQPFKEMFKDTWLPAQLVELQARAVPYIEAIIPIWLISGRKLKEGWFFTALFLVSLAFGMLVAKQDAGHIFLYVLIACAGLYFSPQDECLLGLPKGKRKH